MTVPFLLKKDKAMSNMNEFKTCMKQAYFNQKKMVNGEDEIFSLYADASYAISPMAQLAISENRYFRNRFGLLFGLKMIFSNGEEIIQYVDSHESLEQTIHFILNTGEYTRRRLSEVQPFLLATDQKNSTFVKNAEVSDFVMGAGTAEDCGKIARSYKR